MDNTGTRNNIKVDVLFSAYGRTEIVGSDNIPGNEITCGALDDDSVWRTARMPVDNTQPGYKVVKPSSIRVSTNGSDAFLIDELRIYRTINGERVSGNLASGSASNDDGGRNNVCLSTDPEDGKRSWGPYLITPCQRTYDWLISG